MLKKDDKDGIIAYLKEQLQKICNYQISSNMRIDISDERIYKTVSCPECDEEWEEEIKVEYPEELDSAIKEDAIFEIKDIAEKAINEVTF